MGIGLMKEVLMHAPADMGPSERMVLMVIAEDARDATRESWVLTRAELGRRTGMKPDALKKALQRLAKADLEVRIPLRFSETGKPVYAFEGKQCTYRLPHLKSRELVPPSEEVLASEASEMEPGTGSPLSQEPGTESPHSTPEPGTQSPLWGSEGGTSSPEGGTSSPPTPQYPSTSSPSEKKGGAGGKPPRRRKDEHPRFAEWYQQYPVHKERAAAVKAFTKAAAKVDDIETLFVAAKAYVENDPHVARGFIKNPATWLNKECWLDDHAPLAATGTDGPAGYGPRSDPNSVDWSNGFKIGGRHR